MGKKIYSFVPEASSTKAFPDWLNLPHEPSPDGAKRLLPGSRVEVRSETFGIGSGFPINMETPILQFERNLREDEFVDVILGWRVFYLSDRSKKVFESIDAEAFEFREAVTRFPDGRSGPVHWLCDIVRFLDAVDESRSSVFIKTITSWETGKPVRRVNHGANGTDVFRASVINGFHVFRALYAPSTTFFDEEFVAAVQAKRLTGITPFLAGALDE